MKVGSLVRANVIDTKTDLTPNGNEGAASDVSITGLGVNLGGLTIGASVLTSNATASCVGGVAKLSGKSQVASLNINGVGVSVLDQPLTINIAPLIVISINEQTVGGGKLTQRALHIHSGPLLTDIVIAESVADIHGTPCAAVPPPKPQCSDGVDNDGDGKVDAADPGCHSDGNAGNPGSYVPGDNDESNPPPSSQCSDGVDNDGDGKVDAADPGCHSDGNAGNPGSYVPGDNDESNPPPSSQCSDGVDNDGDGKLDAADPGCHSDGNAGNPGSYVPGDNDESNPPPSSQCSDGVDNDGDGKIDYPADPGCNSPSDNSELDS